MQNLFEEKTLPVSDAQLFFSQPTHLLSQYTDKEAEEILRQPSFKNIMRENSGANLVKFLDILLKINFKMFLKIIEGMVGHTERTGDFLKIFLRILQDLFLKQELQKYDQTLNLICQEILVQKSNLKGE